MSTFTITTPDGSVALTNHKIPVVNVQFDDSTYTVEDAWARVYVSSSDANIPANDAQCSAAGDSPLCRNDGAISSPTVTFTNVPCPGANGNNTYYLKVWLLKNVDDDLVVESVGKSFVGND